MATIKSLKVFLKWPRDHYDFFLFCTKKQKKTFNIALHNINIHFTKGLLTVKRCLFKNIYINNYVIQGIPVFSWSDILIKALKPQCYILNIYFSFVECLGFWKSMKIN